MNDDDGEVDRTSNPRELLSPPGNAAGGLNLAEGMVLSGLTFDELWLRQVAVGGTAGALEIEGYVLGVLHPDRHMHDVIAQALNEHFLDVGQSYPVTYWSNVSTPTPG